VVIGISQGREAKGSDLVGQKLWIPKLKLRCYMCKTEAELKREFVIAATGLESISIVALQRTWELFAAIEVKIISFAFQNASFGTSGSTLSLRFESLLTTDILTSSEIFFFFFFFFFFWDALDAYLAE